MNGKTLVFVIAALAVVYLAQGWLAKSSFKSSMKANLQEDVHD